ncbi:MAG: 2-dehydropantoate 2-reductase [Candidatus Latescibacteria bacterium]|nr:2-dehydropantoate 2-reductase [Candidatus Latescibacterota bacterium]NIM66419.1 2-dehydropantoate 2-reductase [Candidatus Latescibacterota bacterium]NIO02898.1 2-dehydropantoate 2-reductase [Candidatus Latescibacterota bacterium]NIO30033.1 2-dehydropantoate 2-reductase [Candidatus Latescibacterota bacterium]NIO57648.1 2-dehydropantoate 2-reductase [Candidatus Latescibacterota bacterium]
MRIVVFGAGAVGSTLGGLLALNNRDVLLVSRKSHSEAIRSQKGLRIKSGTGDYFASLKSTDKLNAKLLEGDCCIFFTPKSNDTRKCVEKLSKVAPKDIPVISFQNGIANEDIIAEKFSNVYGGVCKMTCSFLQPGHVSFRRIGRLIIGKHPKGSDAFTRLLLNMLSEAGFRAAVSRSIACDKWLKLAANLQSTIHAIIDNRDHDSPEFTALKLGLVEEAKKVFKLHKIKAKPCDAQEMSLDEMISELKKPKAPRAGPAVRVHNSTWQNLYLKRKQIENGFFHGPVIYLARESGTPVPFNEVALEMVTKSHTEELGPEAFRAAEVLEMVKNRVDKK